MQPHPNDLLVCHQRLFGRILRGGLAIKPRYCDLAAYAWCLNDSYYICSMHVNTRHAEHTLQLVDDELAEKGASE